MSNVAQRLRTMPNEKLFDFFLGGHKLPFRAQLSGAAAAGAGLCGGKQASAENGRPRAHTRLLPLIRTQSVMDGSTLAIAECPCSLCIFFIIHSKIIVFLNSMPFLFNANHVIVELERTLTVI